METGRKVYNSIVDMNHVGSGPFDGLVMGLLKLLFIKYALNSSISM